MNHMKLQGVGLVATLGIALCVIAGVAIAAQDFGLQREQDLKSHSVQQFGIGGTLDESSSLALTATQAQANPLDLVTLAGGLKARVVTTASGSNTDMIALWPNDVGPTHLITCNESGTSSPGVQRIDVNSGAVATIVTGTSSCDGIRRTPWGSILFSEEAGGGPTGGRVYELIDPLNTTNVSLNRATGAFSGGSNAGNLTARAAVGRLSYEGFAIYPNGVTYFGDEQRPGTGTPGGAYYKFVPSTLWGGGPPITSLSQSPLADGSVYGLRLGRRSNFTDYGQGTEYGFGKWVSICTSDPSDTVAACSEPDLRALGVAQKLTGYYRPEDIDIDSGAAQAGQVRFCAANTGNEADDQFYGLFICITDGTFAQAATNTATPEAQLLVAGSPDLAMQDNVAYQPGRGNWVLHEDADTLYPSETTPDNNDLWSCLPDGGDADLQSDGCVRIASLNDPTAEWTGGIFDDAGKRFYVSLQHNISGTGVVLEITGWK